jgi:hypothetical protein
MIVSWLYLLGIPMAIAALASHGGYFRGKVLVGWAVIWPVTSILFVAAAAVVIIRRKRGLL